MPRPIGRTVATLVIALLAALLAAPGGASAQTGERSPDGTPGDASVAADVTSSDCGPLPATGPFPDVSGTHPFCVAIEWLADRGITTGYDDGTFRPGVVVTRQAMAAFLYRYSGSPAFIPPASATFSDVPTTHRFRTEIEWLASTDIAGGYDDGTFRPTEPVSRQAIAAFVYRLAGEPAFTPPVTPSFSDVGTAHRFYDEIEWFADTGIANGYDDGTYRPTDPVTRQAYAAFQYRYHQLFAQYDNEVTVALNWQSEHRDAEDAFGGVDDYAAFHLPDDGVGTVTLKWDDGADVVATSGNVQVTSRVSGFHLHTGAVDEEGPVAIGLPDPTFVGAAEPTVDDRGLYAYSLDGEVPADATALADLQAALDAGTGAVDWYVNVHTTHNPAGEARGQLGVADGGLSQIVPIFEELDFHDLGVGTNTGEPQTSFNLYFDAWIDYPAATQDWPDPEDFKMTLLRDGQPPEELEIIRVRGNNPDWQPYPKPDLRLHLDGHDVIEDGDIVTVEILDSGAEKILPFGRNAAAGDVSDSWRTRCTHVISTVAFTSEPCGTPQPQAGLVDSDISALESAPEQDQTIAVTIEAPGLPADDGAAVDGANELWIDLLPVTEEGLVDYSDATWTATVDGVRTGTVEYYLYPEVEHDGTNYLPYLVWRHTGAAPVDGRLVLTGEGIDASDHAVYGVDGAYDTHLVRLDTGRVAYDEIVVDHVAQPLITLEPTDEVRLAQPGATHAVTATHVDEDGVAVPGAELRFTAEREDGSVISTATSTTNVNGQAFFAYAYDGPAVLDPGEPQIDTVNVELVSDPYVDRHTSVIWSAGVATNATTGDTFHDLNDAALAAEANDTITAEGAFTSVYGLNRGDKVTIGKPLTIQADPAGASLLGAFDVRASGSTVDGFTVTHGGGMSYAFRVEGQDITISDNVIDANGVDGFRVRDAWAPVAGGGSATITGNTITGAAVAIGVDGDGRQHEYEVVTHLTVTGNTIAENGTGIYYAASAESTMTVTGNTFEALTQAGDVYVEDAGLADDLLDLDAILAANAYDPAGEVLGRRIVPIDPTHQPSMVRVVEHGTGQGKQYSIVEYTRGVDWTTDDGAQVGSQFSLDRGEDKTPTRVGVDVEAYAPGMVKITWDGNPSFPNEITYTEHADPQYRIHNEHQLPGGGFTDALSPQTLGPPFPKPEDEVVSGAVYLDQGGTSIDGRSFDQGEQVPDVDLHVSVASRSEPATLSLWFDGARPGEGFIAGETICSELLTFDSCNAIAAALAANDGFIDNTVFLDGATLEVNPSAAAGTWQLRFWVVDSVTDEPYFSETFQVTVTTPPVVP